MQDHDTFGRRAADPEEAERRHGKGAVAGLTEDAKEALAREVEDARARAADAAQAVREEARGAGATISTLVSEQAERRKEEAADGLRAFAGAIRQAADDLGERDRSMSSRFVQEAAHGLERFSDSLESRSVEDMGRSIASFGRENPATFLSVCFFAGLAAGRFLIASGARSGGSSSGGYGEWRETDDRWRSDERGGWRGEGDDWRGEDEGRGGDAGGPAGSGTGSGGGLGSPGAAGLGAAGLGQSLGRATGEGQSAGGLYGDAGARPSGQGLYAEGSSEIAGGAGPVGAEGVGGGADQIAKPDPDASRQAGAFGGPVSPSSAEAAPGDIGDALGTRIEDEGESFAPGGPLDETAPEMPDPAAQDAKETRDGDK